MEKRRNQAGKRSKWIINKRMAEKIGQKDCSGYHRGQESNRKNMCSPAVTRIVVQASPVDHMGLASRRATSVS